MELTLALFAMLIGLKVTTAQFPGVGKRPDYFWNDENHRRKETTSCKCGIAKTDKIPWNVFVHVDEGHTVRECIGTIITSNLVVTSHNCLTRNGSHINIFDTWTPPIKHGPKNMVNASSVLVTTSRQKTETNTFQVTKLIFNSLYAVTRASNAFPELDFALLQVKANFTTENDYPICVSLAKDVGKLELFNATGFHYGIGGSAPETEPKQNETALLDYLGGTVVPATECNEALEKPEESAPMKDDNDESSTLCFRFGGRTPPDGEGGPIIMRSPDTAREFLVGIISGVSQLSKVDVSEMEMGLEYSYFSSAIPLIKYFEMHAAEAKSTWCQSSELNLVRQDGDYGRSGPWPWDLGRPIERKESLDNCVCGKPNTELSGRIVGGVEATPYEFGWMVLLRIYTQGRSNSRHSLCGGSIINDRVILTAAHCIVRDDRLNEKLLSKMSVKPGDIDVYTNIHKKYDENSILYKVRAVLFHPSYVTAKIEQYFDYDIALLILAKPLMLVQPGEKGAQPICLTKSTEPYINLVGKKATVAGWGLTDPDNDHSSADALQKIDLPIAPLSLCGDIASVTDRFICAGTLNKYKDAAGGDSGGPLMIKNDDGRWLQVGLVSYGEEVTSGSTSKTAALYTDVQKLIRFIDYHAEKAGAQWCQT